MKSYLEFTYLSIRKIKNKDIDYIPIGAGGRVSWKKYDFELCDMKEYYPRGRKDGSHIFSITFGIFYWGISWTFYKPKKL